MCEKEREKEKEREREKRERERERKKEKEKEREKERKKERKRERERERERKRKRVRVSVCVSECVCCGDIPHNTTITGPTRSPSTIAASDRLMIRMSLSSKRRNTHCGVPYGSSRAARVLFMNQ